VIRFAIPAVCACGAVPIFGRGSPYNPELSITCLCMDCYDGSDDASGSQRIVGYGATDQEALDDFWSGVAEEWEAVL